FRTRTTDSTFTPGISGKVFPILGGACLEQRPQPTQVFSAQLRVVHQAVNVGQSLVVPCRDASGFNEATKILITDASKLHPTTIRALEDTAPDATGSGNDLGGVADPQ